MASYTPLERAAARLLERFPRLRSAVKRPYKLLSYTLARQPGLDFQLDRDLVITTPHLWAGLADPPADDGEWFFGYYDKSPWADDLGRTLLHHHREEAVEVVLIDRDRSREISLGRSTVWNWQQGAMAQWLPGSDGGRVVYNVLKGELLGCRVVDAQTGQQLEFIPWPIQTAHPSGREYLSLNYRRLARLRPDYGYFLPAANFSPDQPLDGDGLWRVETASGRAELIYSLADLAGLDPGPSMAGAEHKVNHAIYSPSGKRFVFMHRWLGPEGKHSRLYAADSSDLALTKLLDERMVSHYHWRNDDQLVVYGRTAEAGDGYYLIDLPTGHRTALAPGRLDAYGDGHCSFDRTGRLMVTDSYPDKGRLQHLWIYHPGQDGLWEIGRFFAPLAFDGPERCDLHPRFSPDGRWLAIDSAHTGLRRHYFIELSPLELDLA